MIHFSKYHGTGNDFILIDDRKNTFDLSADGLIRKLCERRFGIGADGLILIRHHAHLDFEMIYYNADGKVGSMCGNGARCAVHFAQSLEMIDGRCNFQAYDGEHQAELTGTTVSVSMNDVGQIDETEFGLFLDTGSPHVVQFVRDPEAVNVAEEGGRIRNHERFAPGGTNVNFVSHENGHLVMRTFERGVEAETLSCGTGVVAAALATSHQQRPEAPAQVLVSTPGGELIVRFKSDGDHRFSQVWLEGEAVMVFEGSHSP